jgi:hypothetical protein
MLSKIAALAHSKVALAALGVVLVGGGGSAVAVAATSSHLSTLGVNLSEAHSSTETPDSHAHTMGIEGLLTACSTTSTPATISVKDSAGKRWTLVVSATTKFKRWAGRLKREGRQQYLRRGRVERQGRQQHACRRQQRAEYDRRGRVERQRRQ